MDVKMPRKTPHKSQVKNGRSSIETMEYVLSPSELPSTQFLSGGKDIKCRLHFYIGSIMYNT